MKYNGKFRKVVKDKFKVDLRENYLPDQTYINRLIASLDNVEANNYNQSHDGFSSEYKYLEGIGVSHSIKEFVNGCLNQLLWINSILESGKYAETIEDLEEEFDYITPTMLGVPWTLDNVTKKGVFFGGAEPFQESRVIISSENIIEIAMALSIVAEQYDEPIASKKSEQVKSVIISGPIKLTKEGKIKNYCMDLLKKKLHAPKYM